MKKTYLFAAVMITALLVLGTAQATVITFDGLSQSNGSPFTGPYTEGGYTVSAVSGSIFGVYEDHLFGNPGPSLEIRGPLVVNPIPDFLLPSTGSISSVVEVSFGGLPFTLESFDFDGEPLIDTPLTPPGPAIPGGDYIVTGWLGGAPVFTLSGSVAGGVNFTTVSGAPGAIDTLDLALTPQSFSVELDNIVVNTAPVAPPVPEPVSILLVGTSLGGIALACSRRRSR